MSQPYYDHAGITLYHGDNVATMREMIPNASVDLVVTSPPYDNLRTYGGHSWDFEGVAAELWRVIKPAGIVVWIVNDATVDGSETCTSFRQALYFRDIGFRLHDTMIWEKTTPAPQEQHPRYQPCFEYMFVFCSGYPPKVFNGLRESATHAGQKWSTRGQRQSEGQFRHQDGKVGVCNSTRLKRNIWQIRSDQNTGHPAAFPEALVRDHVSSWSNEGDIVLDPFSGSGTTAKVARQMGRRCIGIEINKEYCDVALSKISQGVLF